MTTPDDAGYGQPPSYSPPPYGQSWEPAGAPGAGGYQRPMANGLGIAALIVGLVALPLSLVVVGAALGAVAIVLGILARGRVKRGEASNPGVALAGIITGVLSVVIAAAVIIVVIVYANSDSGRKLRHCLSTYHTTAGQQQCERDAGITVVTNG